MKRFSIRVCILVFACLAGISVCQADELAAVTGLVTDPNGRSVPGVSFVITNLGTNIESKTVTNDQGIYRVPSLQPGIYRITLSKDGFKSIVKSGIELHVQDVASINFELQIGSVNETVTVEAGGLVMNTTDASVGTVVDRKFVENTPLNGRSFQDLISLTPGVVTQSPNASTGPAGSGGDFSVNGQRTESNIYTVDGVSGNVAPGSGLGNLNGQPAASGSVPAGTVLGTTQSLVSVDALQEFRVQSSTYSAEYGGGPGGQFSFVTRSGTNDFHGTLFDYLRNDFFDANDWFNNSLGVPKSPLRQNDFGGTLGGPVLIPGLYHGKDRTFFFASYEGLRLTQPQAAQANQLVPDTFMRQQAPTALQPILNAYPVQNGKDFGTAAAPSLAQFILPFSVPSQIDSTSVRLDHTFGPKLSLFFRVGDTPSSASIRGAAGSALSELTQTSVNIQTYTLGAASQLSSRANNDFRVNYSRGDAKNEAALDNFGGATPINLGAALGAGSSALAAPTMEIFFPGVGLSLLREFPGSNRLRQWNLVDTFSIVSGHHQFRLGVDYRRIVSPANPGSPMITGIYTSPQSILSNTARVVGVRQLLSATPIFNETAAFVQDEWRVMPRLNLSLGLRWEIDPPPHGANGQDAFTLLGSVSNPSSLTLAPRGTPLWNTTWYNFAPRAGLAWTARNKSGWETVVRVGGGVYFDTNNQLAASGFSGFGFQALAQYRGVPLPATPAQVNITPSISAPYNQVNAFPAHLQLPYTLQWNASVQQAMGRSQALTLSYVGAAGRRLMGDQVLSLGALNTNFLGVDYWVANLTSDYHALQAQFQRTVTGGVHALASYTWSHCLDFGSSYGGLPSTRGNCDTDVRHTFQGGVSWDLPGASGNKLVQALVNHWGLDGRLIARTAFPVNPISFQGTDPLTGQQVNGGLDAAPGIPLYLYGARCAAANGGVPCPGGRAFNTTPDAVAGGCSDGTPSVGPFCLPPLDSNGNLIRRGTLGRNVLRGFGEWQINMAVRREFPIHERLRLQFRAEAFNILNHPNFGFIDPNFGNATFGQALSMLNQGLGTVASQYQQGGPRSMQFALKFLF